MKITLNNDQEPGRAPKWRVTCYKNGKCIKRSFATQNEAEAYATDIRSAHEGGADPAAPINALNLCAGTQHSDQGTALLIATVSDGVKRYLAKETFAGLRLITRERAVSAMNHLDTVFGNRALVTITASEVEDFVKQLPNRQGEARKASNSTKAMRLRSIKVVFRAMGVEFPHGNNRSFRRG